MPLPSEQPWRMKQQEARRVYRKMQKQRYMLGQIDEWANGPDPIGDDHSKEFLAGYAAARRHLRERMWAILQTIESDPAIITRGLDEKRVAFIEPRNP